MACRSVLWMTTLAFDRSFMFTSQAKRHGSRLQMTSPNCQRVPNDARGLLRVIFDRDRAVTRPLMSVMSLRVASTANPSPPIIPAATQALTTRSNTRPTEVAVQDRSVMATRLLGNVALATWAKVEYWCPKQGQEHDHGDL